MPTADRRPIALRVVTVVLLAALAAAVGWWLLFTPTGRAVRSDPRQLGGDVRQLVAEHPVTTPIAFVGVYVALAVLCLPIWWLQMFAGMAFGLWAGCGLCLTGSAVGAAVTARLAGWFAGDWFHQRVESKMARLRWLDQTLGNNGLLTVMTLRLTHLVPFGVSNIALGLIGVPTWAIVVGTFVGNLPAVAVYVGLGAGYRPWSHWPFAASVVGINGVLLVPLAVRVYRARRARLAGVPGFPVVAPDDGEKRNQAGV